MIGLWLVLSALAVSPKLHHVLHADSQNLSHECLVTLLGKNHLLLGGSAGIALCVVLFCFGLVLLAESVLFPRRDCRLAPSRAPPAFPPSVVVAG